MRVLSLGAYVLNATLATALLAGCGALRQDQDALPSSGRAGEVAHSKSWMLPEAKSEDLLYLADAGSPGEVSVYSFPKLKFVGTLYNGYRPFGECVDASGNVYIVYSDELVEYAHGGSTPVRTIANPVYDGYLWSCSIDANTGNLAVTAPRYGFGGQVLVFKNASGAPASYNVDGDTFPGYCAYDNHGDLLVLTYPVLGYYPEMLLQLAPGRTKFRAVHIADKREGNWSGGIQWNNGRLVIAGSEDVIRFLFKPMRHRTVRKSSTPLPGSSDLRQFWIQDKWIVVPSIGSNSFNVYKYPSGAEVKTIVASGEPIAAVVSVAAADYR